MKNYIFNAFFKKNKKIISEIENSDSWVKTYNLIEDAISNCKEQNNIGFINVIDENGFPFALPIHIEFKDNIFYYSNIDSSSRNDKIIQNNKISLLFYYKSINQLTVLVKGVSKETESSYIFSSKKEDYLQKIYSVIPTEVSFSFLDENSRENKSINRKVFIYKSNGCKSYKSKKIIKIDTDLDDLEERMVKCKKDIIIDFLK
jgi:general stress protein 26